jgi:hypothetical protein
VNRGDFFACPGSGVWRSTNQGQNWTYAGSNLTGLGNLGVTGFAVIRNDTNGDTIFVATSGGGVYSSTDQGSSWDSASTGLTNRNLYSILADGSTLYAGTDWGGLFRSVNSGRNWSPINDGLPTDIITAVAVGPKVAGGGFIFAGTYADGIWRRPLAEITTGIPDTSYKPDRFFLDQNYPNPFNPKTLIRFSLPEAAFVQLDIYDIRGRKVSSLISARLPAGQHTAEWEGSSLPSGMYFYRLYAGHFTATKKLVLMK